MTDDDFNITLKTRPHASSKLKAKLKVDRTAQGIIIK